MSETVVGVGERAPQFSAPLVRPEGETTEVGLDGLLADGPVLLAFYTNDFSPDCIREWCSFRDYDWFASEGRVQVVGVSRSRESTHRRFIDRLGLGFPLFADRDLAISEAYGVRYRAFKIAARSRRSLFLIDDEGVVRYRWLAEHPLDPSRETPPLDEVREQIDEVLGEKRETFGF